VSGHTVQMIAVVVIVALAVAYTARRLWAQLFRSDDEGGKCGGCALNPAMQDKLRREGKKARRRQAKAGR